MAKKAVLIGCNYPGTKAELKGCINDVIRMYQCLVYRFGFFEDDIIVLIDTDDSYLQPTGDNIRSALTNLVQSAEAGDLLFVHYSGHGTRLPAVGEDDTGFIECIVSSDFKLITDDDFRGFVDKVPNGCSMTMVSDSSHSGCLIEGAKEQIGESTKRHKKESESGSGFKIVPKQTLIDAFESHGIHIPHCHKEIEAEYGHQRYVKSRSLPISTVIEILKQKTGKEDIDVRKLGQTLSDVSGEDASPKVMGGMTQEFLKQKLDLDTNVGSKCTLLDNGTLISGCQTDQTAVEAYFSTNFTEAYGALSNAIQTIIEETDGAVTNKELFKRARKMLQEQGFTQRPGLYCNDNHVKTRFVC